MSIGGPGYPDSPASIALNNAEKVNITSIISAGNSGSLSETVGSPAAAESALAVGSVNDDDELNQFSSRGPQKVKNSTELLMKPEISAPGYQINSTYRGNFSNLSGTSFAAPHVSGAAALLLQSNPSLTPKEVTGILTETSTPIEREDNIEDADLSETGTGRVNVTEALNTSSVAIPETLSFGLSNFTDGEWNVSRSLLIRNFGNDTKNYTISKDSVPEGASFYLESKRLELSPEESKEIQINISAIRSSLQQGTYTGKFKVVSNQSEKLIIPYIFEHEDFSVEVSPKQSKDGILRIHLESPYEYAKSNKQIYIKHPGVEVSKVQLNKRKGPRELDPENQDWYRKIQVNQTGQYKIIANSSKLPGKKDTAKFMFNKTKPALSTQSTFYGTRDKL
ncbi:MAG: subtilisin-like serine protease, partial [Candidatus Nanosalina sp. J07AB43]